MWLAWPMGKAMQWRSQEGVKVVVPAVGIWSWGRAVRSLSILQQLWTSKVIALGRESFGQPSSTPNKSVVLVLTISPSQKLCTKTQSQSLTCILHSAYSSTSWTKLLPCPIGLTKVHVLTVLVNKVPIPIATRSNFLGLTYFMLRLVSCFLARSKETVPKSNAL